MITIRMSGKVWDAHVDALGDASEDFDLTRGSREWATSPAPAGRFGHIREATVPEEVAVKVADVLDGADAVGPGAKAVAATIRADLKSVSA